MGCFGSRTMNATVILVGLDAAGKSSVLHCLQFNDALTDSRPTIGHNKASLERDNINYEFWDVGGQQNIRDLWAHYLKSASAIIFVVDSADRERIDGNSGDTAKEELANVLKNPDLNFTAPLLVLANKQDKMEALSDKDIENRLDLKKISDKRSFLVKKCCAVNMQDNGIEEGIQWLGEALRQHKKEEQSKSKS